MNSWTQWGWALGSWWHHYRFASNQHSDRRIDWWFNGASPPDHFGYFNCSYGTNCCNIYRQTSKRLVVEVRSDYPWAEGGRFNTIHIDEVDYWVEVDCEKYTWPQVDILNVKISEEEKRIAQYILSIMDDRDVVQLLPEGSIVDLPAQLAHYVCTEYGLANLRGLNGYERAAALISIAHPDERQKLERAAHFHGLLPRCFPVDMLPEEDRSRRYPSYQERRDYKNP